MSNIFDEGTLVKVSMQLKIAPNWINDLQRKTGIPKPIGRKGERVYFEPIDIEKIRVAYILRTIGLSFSEIKKINDRGNFLQVGLEEALKRIEARSDGLNALKRQLEEMKVSIKSLPK